MESSRGKEPATHDRLITQFIAHHCQTRPDAEAICSSGGESMSYRILERTSSLLAETLTTQGVGPEVIVPLCFEKSTWTTVAIVAVLKAGGAFVLLDPAHPTERLKTIISKCKSQLAITSHASQERMSQLLPQVLCLDKHILSRLEHASTTPDQVDRSNAQARAASPTNIAYVVYTSGSTGQPKGAVIEHGSFCAGAVGHARAFGMDEYSRVVQFASYNFDASITEILTTLVVGGTVCVISDAERLDPIAFTAAVTKMRANFALLTASFITALPVDGLTGLKTLVQGGEALPELVQERWAERVVLMNAYGQVEASVVSTCTARISPQSSCRSIGKAIAGRCWVVNPDKYHELTRPGEIGELLVEGPHVGRGYLDEPEKTAAVFVSRPRWHTGLYPKETDARALRFYRTGDLVIEEEDGSFTFAGRKDEQVKLNGQRIEIGEIEHQFTLALPPGREIVVDLIKRKTRNGTHGILMGFVALGRDWTDDVTAQQLLDKEMAAVECQVSAVLPKFMIPATFIATQKIPISMNGKVDRKMLRVLGEARLTSNIHSGERPSDTQPGTQAENLIREVWSKVLNIPEKDIDRTSVFQSLGGDSISAMQVVSQVASRGARISVQRILQQKTVQAIARGLDLATPSTSSSEDDTEDEIDEDMGEPFALSPIQQLFFDLSPEGHNHDNISFLLRLHKNVSRNAFEEALEAVVTLNPMLRARFFKLQRGKWFQYVSANSSESYTISSSFGNDIASDIMPIIRKSQRSLNIKDGPLIRADLFDMKNGSEQLLFICAHHLVTDFVSWRIILQQLEEHLKTGTISRPKSYSFQRWCWAQRRHVRRLPSQELPSRLPPPDLAYWGMEQVPNVYGDAVTETVLLEEDLSSAILGAASNGTLEIEAVDVLLSAVMFAFHQTFPERDIPAFFVEGHGREPWDDSIDLSTTVGWFTTILPMIISAGDCASPMEAVQRVKSLRTSFPDKGLAYFASKYYKRRKQPNVVTDDSMEITFNYAGMYQQLERQESLFSEVSALTLMNLDGFGQNMPRFGLVEILGNVEHGRIKLSFTLNRRMRRQERIREWMQRCCSVLAQTTSQLSTARPDFPVLEASASESARLIDHLLPSIGVSIADVEDVYPCTPMQNGMLMSRASQRGSYSSQIYLRVESKTGSIEVDRLDKAWQAVVEHHAALRTVFVESPKSDGSFVQVVLRHVTPAVMHTTRPLAEQAASSWTINKPEHQLVMEVASPRHVLLRLDISHALIDGSSTPTLIRDLQNAYDIHDQFKNTPRPMYSNYVRQISTLAHDTSLLYWQQHLTDISPCHLPRWSDESENVLELAEVPDICSQDIMTFCRTYALTLSDLLKTVWAVVLHAYTGSESPIFGYLSSGRGEEHADMLGVFTNIQPCATQLSSTQSVHELLKRIQNDSIDQMPHRECPLADIVHSIATIDTSQDGLFNTAMSLQRTLSGEENSSLSVKVTREMDPTEYTATFLAYVTGNDVKLEVEYWTSRIPRAQALNVAATVSKVLESIVMNPDSTIGQLNLLSRKDKTNLLQWNRTLSSSVPVDSCIHEIMEQVFVEQPDAPAVNAWDGKLTYGELDQLSWKLAGHLYGLGVRPETIVPVCMDKSVWTIVAMLAVLRAGGAFVPFDPDAPTDRLLRLLEDTAASFVLVSPKTMSRLEGHIQQVIISPAFMGTLSGREFPQTVLPENLAYILFTSGSTGTPKGIMMQHSQFLASSTRYGPVIGLSNRSRVLQFSAYTFDASIFELWSTLTSGGCVCQMSDEQRMNDVAGAIRDLDADVMFMTPTMLGLMEPRDVPSIRTIITGGEVIPQEVFRIWAPAVHLIEAYGPTETAVYATFQTGTNKDSDRFSIGRSFCCRAWVIDPEEIKIVPIGATGELWLEGPSLARGYLNNHAQTAKAFVSHQDWLYPSRVRRFYRTGDLVRFKADGNLQFVGRKDTQVKIRGQRIELAELEHKARGVLESSVAVAAEVVDSKLILFIEAQGQPEELNPSMVSVLEQKLPTLLPRFMVPSAILPVTTAFPRSSSGKLDRKALRIIGQKLLGERRTTRSGGPLKFDLVEQKVLQILARVLGVPLAQISLEDRFFHLGGDSFLAMKTVAAARAEDLHLSVSAILRNPSVRELAREASPAKAVVDKEEPRPFRLLGDLAESIRAEAVSACSVESIDEIEDIYPVTPLQEAFVVASAKNPMAYAAAHVVELPMSPEFDPSRFKTAWEICVRENTILRTRLFQTLKTKPPRPMQAVVRQVDVDWETDHDLNRYLKRARNATATTLNKVAMIDDRSSGARYFVWLAHHSLYDGFSLNIALRRVHDILTGTVTMAKTLPFRDYIEYLHTVQDSGASTSFWKSYLADAPSPCFPPAQAGNGDRRSSFSLKVPIQPRSQVTIATVLRAAWAILMGVNSGGAKDVVFGSIVHGRNAPLDGIETVMGPTIAAIPVRVRFDREEPVQKLLFRVQAESSEMIPHEALGLRTIQSLNAATSRACSFGCLFVVQSSSQDDMPYKVSSREINLGSSSSYPLTVVCSPTDGQDVGIEVTYSAEVMQRTQVEHLIRQFELLVSSFTTANSALKIRDIDLSSINTATSKEARPHCFIKSPAASDSLATSDTENLLRKFWGEAMGLEDSRLISRQQNFLALGGDSITAMQLSGIARREGFLLPVVDILGKPSLQEMAVAMAALGSELDESKVSPAFSLLPGSASSSDQLQEAAADLRVNVEDLEDMYPCTPLQEGLMTSSDTQASAYVARLMIDLPLDDISRFKAAWDAVVTSHPILRTRVVHLGAAGMFQVVLKPSRPAIEWHESTNLDEYVAQDRNVPMGFGDPLVRYGLIKTTEGLSFIWTAHHAIYDGATVSMLSEAVSKAYMGNALDEPPPFKRLLSYLTKLDPAHSDQFWRETLAGARPMPFPVPRLDDPSTTVDSVITRDVSIQAKPSGITIATLLQVAWSFVLARYSGSDDVVLGLAQSGRMISVPEIDRIPGPAVTTVPMRVRFDSEQTIPNLLETVQKTNTDSIPHCHRGLQNIKRVSEDARQACGFRSLLTIYPKKEEQELVFDMSNGRVVEGGAADFHTYPLLLECQFTDSTARVTATHDSKVIDVDQMLWMIQQLDHVIQQLTTPINGCISIGEIELFTPEQRQKIKAAGCNRGEIDGVQHIQKFVVDIRNRTWLTPPGTLGEVALKADNQTSQLIPTGELGIFNCDGSVKIVGHRRELLNLDGRLFIAHDIEKLVSRYLWDRDVSLQVTEDMVSRGKSSLTAFVALGAGYVNDEISQQLLDALVPSAQDQLGRVLPSFMVPSRWIPVRSLPPPGLDERSSSRSDADACQMTQRSPSTEHPSSGRSLAAFEMESRLVFLWEKILGFENVSPHDSFLRLGGDSLDAMKLVAAARREGIQLTVKDIFDNPTMSEMAQVAKLIAAPTESFQKIPPFSIIQANATEVVDSVAAACQIDPGLVEDVYPCTPLQEGLMALSNMEHGAYIAEYVVPLPNVELFERAWNTLIAATPILRTRVVQTDRWGFLQVVVKGDASLSYGTSLTRHLAASRQVSISPGCPLVRASVVTEATDAHFVLFAHHAVFDGWAWNLILHHLHQLYQGKAMQVTPPYNYFIQYLHESLDTEEAEQFWRSYLEHADRTAFPSTSVSMVPKPDAESTRHISLAQKSKESVGTLGSLINTAWALLVGRYVDSHDVTIGAVLSGRTVPVDGIQDMIGPIFTTVPMRFNLDGSKSISELVRGTQNISISSAQHIGLQRIRQVSSSAQAACDFSSIIVVQPASEDDDEGPENFFLRKNDSHLISDFTNYSLVFLCQILPDGNLDASMVFDSRIISQRQAVRLLAQFEHVLAQLWNDNSISIDQVDFLSPADKDEISSHLNDPPPTSSATLCLHDIIESHALSRPDSLAVASWDGDLTYSDLNSLADKLATQLARLADVGPGATVPLCFEKSKWTQVAMLGVLKAGAAFVLLDPANPVSRLESICRRVNATVAVVSKSFSHALTPLVQTNIVLDDSLRDSPLEPPLSVSTSPDSAAYVITTSGTTGEPKACVIEHRSIVAEAMAFATVAHVDANTRAMQFASYNFDACLIETIMIWAAGGCTCVLSETDRKDNLAGAINKLKINWALMTPSLAGLLEPELVPTLRTVVLGGEAATLELRTIWADAVTLLQAYGPCECCPVACCSPQPMDSSSNPRNIGKPLPGVHAWVIDPKDQNRLAPAGSVGELLLEGPTVGRGYVNEPAKTAAAFINPPSWRERFPGQPQRFYRTGDLVRLDYAGTLEFIGRKDSQVKIRGIRLELAEIEHHLKRLMSIPSDIAVELCCNQDRKISRGRLTAFITLGKAFDSSEDIVARALDEALGDVRTKLTDFLPSYMIPSTFVPLRTLPLNPSGKIDRKALRELGSRIQSDHIEHRGNQPSTSTEQILQSLWARVLNIEVGKIHTEASFLELGGDSLAAMRLASKAREAGISLGVADILRQPRFADMESAVQPVIDAVEVPDYKPLGLVQDTDELNRFLDNLSIARSDVEDIMEATSTQKSMTLASTSLFQGTINHIWLDFDGAVDSTRLKDACTTLVNHHGILRTLFAFWGESLMQVILRSSQAEFRERKANDNVEEATMEFVGESKQGVEKLGRSGLRFCFINHRAGGRLVIRVPHSLYDGISLPLVLDHLRLAYEGLSIPVSPSFTKYLNAWRFLQETGGSKTFWQKRLQGSVMTEIIASKYQNHPQDANGHLMQRIIHAPFSSSKHTFETLLHVSWALVLRALSGKSDIVFGRAVANRNLPIPASDNVVGPCLNTVPVRVQFDRFRTYYDLLSTTENERLAALPYECLETDVLISDCTSWRTGSRFSSLLVHNNLTAAKTFDDGRLPHFGGIPCSLGWTVSPWDAADVQITSTPETTTNSIRIDLVYAKAALPQELAQIMLSRLCQTIGTLCESGDQDLEPTVTQHKCLPVVPGCGSPYSFNVSSPNSPAPSTPSSYELV